MPDWTERPGITASSRTDKRRKSVRPGPSDISKLPVSVRVAFTPVYVYGESHVIVFFGSSMALWSSGSAPISYKMKESNL